MLYGRGAVSSFLPKTGIGSPSPALPTAPSSGPTEAKKAVEGVAVTERRPPVVLNGQAAWTAQAAQPGAFTQAQTAVLNAFAGAEAVSGLEPLAPGAFRATTAGGSVVLRLHDYDAREANHQHVPFDAFASEVLAALEVPSLTVRAVPADHPAVGALLAHPSRNRDPMLRQQGGATPVRASVSPDVQLVSGVELTRSLGADLRASLVNAKTSLGRYVDAEDRVSAELKGHWERMTPSARGAFLADLKKIDPEAKISERRPAASLLALVQKTQAADLVRLHDRMWDRLSPTTQTDLARAWAGLTVLGAQDVSPHKWSLAGERVVVTGLAERSEAAYLGTTDPTLRLDPAETFDGSLATLHQQHGPLSGLPLSDGLRSALMAKVPEDFVPKLKRFDASVVAGAVERSGYKMHREEEGAGYVARAGALAAAKA